MDMAIIYVIQPCCNYKIAFFLIRREWPNGRNLKKTTAEQSGGMDTAGYVDYIRVGMAQLELGESCNSELNMT